MIPDLTTLKYKIDTSDALKAQRDLNTLAKAGQGVEASIRATGKAAFDTGRYFNQFSGVGASLAKRLASVGVAAEGVGGALASPASWSENGDLSGQVAPAPQDGFGICEEPSGDSLSQLVSARTTTPDKSESVSSGLYDRMQDLGKDAIAGLEEYQKAAEDIHEDVKSLFNNSMKQMGASLYEFVKTGKLNFSSLANSIVSDLMRITFESQVMGPLAKALAGGLGSLLGVYASGGAPGTAQGTGPASHANDDAAWNNPGFDWSTVNPGYANGGISYGKQLAWVSEGAYAAEAHVPLPNGRAIPVEMRDGGGSNVTVNVIDQRANGGEVKTRESRGPNGRQIDVYVVDAVNRAMRTGAFDRSMESNFGLARAGAR